MVNAKIRSGGGSNIERKEFSGCEKGGRGDKKERSTFTQLKEQSTERPLFSKTRHFQTCKEGQRMYSCSKFGCCNVQITTKNQRITHWITFERSKYILRVLLDT